MDIITNDAGWIEVITGSMYSGKSEELIRRLRRAEIARQKVQVFKPGLDERYSADHIVSHSELKMKSIAIDSASEIMEKLDPMTTVIGIDEAQFFDATLIPICNKLAAIGKRVVIAGLDMDYKGQPFEPMPQLLAIAEYVTKAHAICVVCGNPANYSQRIVLNSNRVLVGAAGMYEARCRKHFDPNPVPPTEDLFDHLT
jgi:thymidine kinase